MSGFAVGAAIVSTSGETFVGQNQENFAFSAIHAEMAALKTWNEAGRPQIALVAVAGLKFWPVVDKRAVITPCGGCRQWLFEAAIESGSDPMIICANGDLSQLERHSLSALLPGAFTVGARNPFENWPEMRRCLHQAMPAKR